MEKSIETVWKEGFLRSDALVAPQLNNLYNQKSSHIVDKFRRMYQINRIALVVFALILLPVSFIVQLPYLGIPMSLLFCVVAIVSTRFKNRLDDIDKGSNSYQYLTSFYEWINDMVTTNSKMSTYLYPYIFLSLILGFWFGGMGGDIPGEEFTNNFIQDYPDTYLVFGLPLFGIIGMLFIVGLLAYFGGKIGKWDINLVYGGVLEKLDTLLKEMEELKK